MGGKKIAKINENNDKEECGSTKGDEDLGDLCTMIQGLALNANDFMADAWKDINLRREGKLGTEDLNLAADSSLQIHPSHLALIV